MKIQASFLSGWRESYVRMAEEAQAGIAEALFRDMPPVPISEHPSEKNLLRRALSGMFKEVDDDFWREFDIEDAASWMTAEKLSKAWVKEHPECAARHEGLRALLTKMSAVHFTAERCTDKWLLRVLEDFRGIYAKDPDMCDYDAMVGFLTLEDLMKNKEDPEVFAAIPREDCEALDLRLSKNLKPWLERYEIAVNQGPDAPITEMESGGITVDYTYDYPERVAYGADDAFRWTYDRGKQGGHAPTFLYWQSFRVFAIGFSILFLPVSIVLLILSNIWEPGAVTWPLSVLTIGASLLYIGGFSALAALWIYRRVHARKVNRYKLNREGVWVLSHMYSNKDFISKEQPGSSFASLMRASKGRPALSFGRVKRVEFLPQYNMVMLRQRKVGTGIPIFVPPEDYQMIREFILANVNRQTKVIG